MPLAIYMALESDVRVAVALSLVLAAAALLLLLALRAFPALWGWLGAATWAPVPGPEDGP